MTDAAHASSTEPQDLRPDIGAPRLADDAELVTPAESEADINERPALWPFYVYELRDPRNNEVFYVGKGTGDRADHHVADERTRKGLRIGEIEAAKLQVKRVLIGRFRTEAEAFAVESVLIKWVYGFANLTNCQ